MEACMDNMDDKPFTIKVEVPSLITEVDLVEFTQDLKEALATGAVAATKHLANKYVEQNNNNIQILLGKPISDNKEVGTEADNSVYQSSKLDNEEE
jgi:hypothetical protein